MEPPSFGEGAGKKKAGAGDARRRLTLHRREGAGRVSERDVTEPLPLQFVRLTTRCHSDNSDGNTKRTEQIILYSSCRFVSEYSVKAGQRT